MLMLLMMSFSVSVTSFAAVNSSTDIIFADQEEKKTSDDEEPDCE